jgi:hypothetical protein
MTPLEGGGQRPLHITSPAGRPSPSAPLRRSAGQGPDAPHRHTGSPSALPAPTPAPAPAPASPGQATAPSGAPHRLPTPQAHPRLRRPPEVSTARRGWRGLDTRLLAVLGRLTERDRQICRLLDAHRVLTAAQVADACFSGERRARMRLGELYALDVLDRFRPRRSGRPVAFHYVLGPLGAALVAAEHGTDPADLAWRRRDAAQLAASQRLAHLVGTNGFFCALLRSARTRPGCRLAEWWSERRCATEWGEVVRPDGYGIWQEGTTSLPFLYEHDNGTERLDRLAAKLTGYARLAAAAGHPNWVLFSFPTPRREKEARRVLAHPTVPVATTARSGQIPPDGPVWLPAGTDTAIRLHLADLAGHPQLSR